KACVDKSRSPATPRASAKPAPSVPPRRETNSGKWSQGQSRMLGKNTPAGFDKRALDGRVRQTIERTPRDQQHVIIRRHASLMQAKHLAQTAFGTIAEHGPAHGGGGGDHAQT